jgi:hypothetical protein
MQHSFAALLFLCGIGVASAAGGDVSAAQVFKSYQAAMNRHDAMQSRPTGC